LVLVHLVGLAFNLKDVSVVDAALFKHVDAESSSKTNDDESSQEVVGVDALRERLDPVGDRLVTRNPDNKSDLQNHHETDTQPEVDHFDVLTCSLSIFLTKVNQRCIHLTIGESHAVEGKDVSA